MLVILDTMAAHLVAFFVGSNNNTGLLALRGD
jgi:hypothetical protein